MRRLDEMQAELAKQLEWRRAALATLLALTLLAIGFLAPATATAADGPAGTSADRDGEAADEDTARIESEPRELRFTFRHAPWEDVLEWLAEQADLALSKDVVPLGTFNYWDPDRVFTLHEAMDVINKHLLIKGYTLVRNEQTLLVLDYENEIDQQVLRELLTETPLDRLDRRGDFEMTKTTFALEHMDAAEAEKQIAPLLTPPFGHLVVMPGAGQILATDTGRTLRKIQAIVEGLEETAETKNKNKVHIFRLRSANAHEVLTAARPLVQLDEDESAAEDGSIRISADAAGRTVFAAGTPEKVKIVQELVQHMDSGTGDPYGGEQQQFIAHTLRTAQPEAVLRVLQTLLGDDPSVRLEIDPSGGGIMAMATPSQHRAIQATIAEMEQHSDRLEVIPLAANDPSEVVGLVTSMFATSQNPPTVNGTFSPPQLVVRGSDGQIEKIRSLLERMGERFGASPWTAGTRGNVRVFQMDADQARLLVERIEQIWPRISEHPVTVVRPGEQSSSIRRMRPDAAVIEGSARRQAPAAEGEPSDGGETAGRPTSDPVPQRLDDRDVQSGTVRDRTAATDETATATAIVRLAGPARHARLVSEQTDVEDDAGRTDGGASSGGAASRPGADQQDQADETSAGPSGIVLVPTPGGLMVTSEDEQALGSIESLIEMFAGQSDTAGPRYHLFYLRHVDAEEAVQLLTSLLSGGTATTSSTSTSLGGVVGGSSVSMAGMAGAPLNVSAPTIVANKRLNSLFVQGTQAQVRLIDQLLQVIDIESGPEEVLTFPRPHFIPVYNTSAEEVVAVLEKLYVHRIETGQSNNRNERDRRGRGRGFGRWGGFGGRDDDDDNNQVRQDVAGNLSKMTLAADTTSNSVVVSAPGPLVNEVEMVVRDIDSRAAEAPPPSVGVVSLKYANSSYIKDALVNVLGDQAETSQTATNGRARGSANENRQFPGGPGAFFRRGGFGRGFGGDSDGGRSDGGDRRRNRGGRGGNNRDRGERGD